MVQVNCSAMLAMTNLILPIMEEKKKGAMIFMSSSSGIHETPMMAIYSATKAFIYKFAQCLSEEVCYSIYSIYYYYYYYYSAFLLTFLLSNLSTYDILIE